MSTFPDSHPYWHLRALVEAEPDLTSVEFSYYQYVPQTVADSREVFRCQRSAFLNPGHVGDIANTPPEGAELACHSRAYFRDGSLRHVLMVDMSTAARAHLDKLRTFLGEQTFGSISWFSSGRSFHGYGSEWVDQENWVKFMGLLLLANRRGFEPTVDPRWIGHRLLAGYSALRWTRHTGFYLSTPKRVDARTSKTVRGTP